MDVKLSEQRPDARFMITSIEFPKTITTNGRVRPNTAEAIIVIIK